MSNLHTLTELKRESGHPKYYRTRGGVVSGMWPSAGLSASLLKLLKLIHFVVLGDGWVDFFRLTGAGFKLPC